MAKTNKQLLEAGLVQYEILELVEQYLIEFDFVNYVEEDGDEYEYTLYVTDDKDRTYSIGFEYERKDTITFNSMKGEERKEQNIKEFKSITALLNHIKHIN